MNPIRCILSTSLGALAVLGAGTLLSILTEENIADPAARVYVFITLALGAAGGLAWEWVQPDPDI